MLELVFYLLYNSDILQFEHVTFATCADNTTILAVEYENEETIDKLQQACDSITKWNKTWIMRINKNKTPFNNKEIVHYDTVKYL